MTFHRTDKQSIDDGGLNYRGVARGRGHSGNVFHNGRNTCFEN